MLLLCLLGGAWSLFTLSVCTEIWFHKLPNEQTQPDNIMLCFFSFLLEDPCRKLKDFALINSEKPEESGGVISLGLRFHPSNVSALNRQGVIASADAQGSNVSRPAAAVSTQPSPAQPALRQDGSLLASLRAALGRHTADSATNVRGSKRASPEPVCEVSPLIFIAESCDMSPDENDGLERHSDRMLKKGRPLGLDIEAELKKVVGEIVTLQAAEGESGGQSSVKGSPWSQSEVLQGGQRKSLPAASAVAIIQTSVRASKDLRFGSLTIPDLDFECEESPRSRRIFSAREKKVLEDLKICKKAEGSHLWQKDLDSPGALFFWGETEQVIDGGLEAVLKLPKEGAPHGHQGGGVKAEDEGKFEFDFDSFANRKEPIRDVSQSLLGGWTHVTESCESIGSVKQGSRSFGSEGELDGELEGEMRTLGSRLVVLATPTTPMSEKSASSGQKQLLWQRRMQKNERKRCEEVETKDGKRQCDGVRREHWQIHDNVEALVGTATTLQEQYSRNFGL